MLVDDNEYDNFFHERTIREYDSAISIVTKRSATEALEFIKTKLDAREKLPDLLLLDINMPGMNGWDFLDEYEKLNDSLDVKMCIVILTTSSNPDDEIRAKTFSVVSGFITKPLTKETLNEIIDKYLVPA